MNGPHTPRPSRGSTVTTTPAEKSPAEIARSIYDYLYRQNVITPGQNGNVGVGPILPAVLVQKMTDALAALAATVGPIVFR